MSTNTKGKSLANVIVVINWILLAISTLAVVALLGFCLGYVDATNTFVESYTSIFNSKNEDKDFDSGDVEKDLTIKTDILIFYGIVIGACLLFQALLNTLLTVAVKKADHRKLNIWLLINMLLMFISIYSFFRRVYIGQVSSAGDVIAELGGLAWIVGSLLAIKYFRDGLDTTTAIPYAINSEKIPYMKV